MKQLIVLTAFPSQENSWLDECKDSVAKFLPKDSEHRVIQCSTLKEVHDNAKTALKEAEYLAFVDYDDLVVNDSLNKCLTALKSTKVGVAFTEELLVNRYGSPYLEPLSVRLSIGYDLIASSPRACHHLAVMRTSSVQEGAFGINQSTSAFVDWGMKASAALVHDAIRVPILGYHWRQHEHNLHKSPEWKKSVAESFTAMREYLRPLRHNRFEVVPFFDTDTGEVYRTLPKGFNNNLK